MSTNKKHEYYTRINLRQGYKFIKLKRLLKYMQFLIL